jgi:hypothetical protein
VAVVTRTCNGHRLPSSSRRISFDVYAPNLQPNQVKSLVSAATGKVEWCGIRPVIQLIGSYGAEQASVRFASQIAREWNVRGILAVPTSELSKVPNSGLRSGNLSMDYLHNSGWSSFDEGCGHYGITFDSSRSRHLLGFCPPHWKANSSTH